MSQVTMRQLLEAGAHFGHRTRYWNPQMRPYIFGARNKIHIINLEDTLPLLREACNAAGRVAADGGKVLFVGTKRAAQDIVAAEAARCEMPYVNRRWLGGMLTNFKTVKGSIKRMQELRERLAEGQTKYRLSKKEQLTLTREYEKLHSSLGGIEQMTSLPDVLFVIDVGYEDIAVREAKKLGIPVIGVVDTNNSPQDVDIVIPGNDDAIRAISVYAGAIADAVIDARGAKTTAPRAEAAEAEAADAPAES
ncbi:MAG: 30S ribosomal protein S2 [Oceanococcaceae bacterium]